MLLVRANLRHLRSSPWQAGMALLGMTLGVAVVVAIDLSLASAEHAFVLANRLVVGTATHRVTGGPKGLAEDIYVRLRKTFRDLDPRPMIIAPVSLPSAKGYRLQLIGIDPLAGAALVDQLRDSEPGSQTMSYEALLQRADAVLIATSTAAYLGLAVGDRLAIDTGGQIRQVRVMGFLNSAGEVPEGALADLMVTDIASAQELLGTVGYLTHVDLTIDQTLASVAKKAAVVAHLPPGVSLSPASRSAETARELTAAFEFNLRMLSALALLVGMFLIYNSVTFSVVSRRSMFARLRALGVTARQIMSLVLFEAALLGMVAVMLGALLGYTIAWELLGLVGGTIDALYFPLQVETVEVSAEVLLKATVFGICACLLAAWLPAREATRVSARDALTRSGLEMRTRRALPRSAGAGVALLGLAGLLLLLPVMPLEMGFLALFCVMVGFVLLTPAVIVSLARLAVPLSVHLAGPLATVCLRGVVANLNRVSVAVCALMVALGASIGMAIMVDSFRRDVSAWLEQTLAADIYVSLPGQGAHRSMSQGFVRRIASLPEVNGISTARRVQVETLRGQATLLAIEARRGNGSKPPAGLQFTDGPAPEAWANYRLPVGLFISEPLAARWTLRRDSRLVMETDQGRIEFRVAGVYRDYASQRGVLRMSRENYDRYFDDPGFTSVGIYLQAGTDTTAIANQLRATASTVEPVIVRSTGELRERSLAIFDRTFLITRVLHSIILLVAFVGVMGAIIALQLASGRDHAILRIQGLTKSQLRSLLYCQGGLIGLFAAILAIPLGIVLGWLLVAVINRRAFGWTIDFFLDPQVLVQALLVAIVAALAASVYPAWGKRRGSLADALRYP